MLDDDPSKAPLKDNHDGANDINLGDDWAAFSSSNKQEDEDDAFCEDSPESSEDEFVGSVAVQPSNAKWKREKVRLGHVSLKLTLAFCYLGLLWIDEPVFMSDLIRYYV